MLKSAFSAALAVLASSPFSGVLAATCTPRTFSNPVLYSDFPDNDVSVGPDGAFYFSASNFHYSPGAPILRSYDLVDWEFVGHSIPRLDFGDRYDLPADGERAYRGGTWASTMRYRKSNGLWYWVGCTNFANSWVFTAPKPEGPWTKTGRFAPGVCYYDLGLMIDDDDTMYLVYSWGSGTIKQVNVTQLAPDGLSAVRTERVLAPSQVNVDWLEGNRMYKKDGLYYIFNDDPNGVAFVWKSTSPWGPYEAKPLANHVTSPLPGGNSPHQGSLIETSRGWYFMSFTWAFPSGRLPVLAPIKWQDDGFPTLVTDAKGGWGASYPYPLPRKPLHFNWTRPSYDFAALSSLPPTFEWNHNPDTSRFSLSRDAGLTLSAASVTTDLYAARNTLTHRVFGASQQATILLDFAGMADGDRAGLAAFKDRSAYISVHRSGEGRYNFTALFNATQDEWSGTTLDLGTVVETVAVPEAVAASKKVWLRVGMDVRPDGDKKAKFAYSADGKEFVPFGGEYQLYDGWAWFLGYRFGVFNYATRQLGGSVNVRSFAAE